MWKVSLGANRSKSFGRDDWERNAQSMNWFAAALPLVQNNVGVCYSIQAFFQIESALCEQRDASQT